MTSTISHTYTDYTIVHNNFFVRSVLLDITYYILIYNNLCEKSVLSALNLSILRYKIFILVQNLAHEIFLLIIG